MSDQENTTSTVPSQCIFDNGITHQLFEDADHKFRREEVGTSVPDDAGQVEIFIRPDATPEMVEQLVKGYLARFFPPKEEAVTPQDHSHGLPDTTHMLYENPAGEFVHEQSGLLVAIEDTAPVEVVIRPEVPPDDARRLLVKFIDEALSPEPVAPSTQGGAKEGDIR